jgi:hypothetical protein
MAPPLVCSSHFRKQNSFRRLASNNDRLPKNANVWRKIMADIKSVRTGIIRLAMASLIVLVSGVQGFGQSAGPTPKKPSANAKTQDLAQIPELLLTEAFAKPINAEAARVLITEGVKNANLLNKTRIDGFVDDLRKNRPDLKGLPFVMGDDCRMAEDRHRSFATAGESVHQAIAHVKSREPSKQTGPVIMDAFQRAYVDIDSGLPEPSGVTAQLTLPPLVRLALKVHQNVALNKFAPENAKKPIAAAQIAALMQVLAPESAELRVGLANYLGRIPHAEATRALARLAIFSEEAEVRQAACKALKARDGKDYTSILVEGLNYPWPAVAQRASEAIVQLKRTELIPQLIRVLEQPEPGTPSIKEIEGKKVVQVRELVRINHHRNCLLCHAPGNTADIPADAIRAEMPVPGEPFPSHSCYGDRGSTPEFAVRIDVTYLRQDFSRRLKVADAAPWPEWQRFDFLVRTRTLTDQDAKAHREFHQPHEPGELSSYQRAAVVGLRALTGRDTEPTAAAWRKLVGME